MSRVIAIGAVLLVLVASPLFAGEKRPSRAEQRAAEAWAGSLPEANADYGSPPVEYERMMKEYFAGALKDPESARYAAFTAPRTGYNLTNMFTREVTYGYFVCTSINAKNSFGGYVGNKLAVGFFRDGKLVIAGIDGGGDFKGTLIVLTALKQGYCKQG